MNKTFLGNPNLAIVKFLARQKKTQTVGGIWIDSREESAPLSEYSTAEQNRIWKNTSDTATLTFQKNADNSYTVIYKPSYAGTVEFRNCDGTEKELTTMTRFGICHLAWQAS